MKKTIYCKLVFVIIMAGVGIISGILDFNLNKKIEYGGFPVNTVIVAFDTMISMTQIFKN